jgi:hypothetical protein
MTMLQVHDGQCGLCTHFGEQHPAQAELVQVRTAHSAPEAMIDNCGHPKHAALNLKVTAISGCDGFEPAKIGKSAGKSTKPH